MSALKLLTIALARHPEIHLIKEISPFKVWKYMVVYKVNDAGTDVYSTDHYLFLLIYFS